MGSDDRGGSFWRAASWAIAGVTQAVVYFFVGLDLFKTEIRPLVALWIAAPLPSVYWIAARFVRGRTGFGIVVASMIVAFAFSAWAYWEITWGESRRTESMSGCSFSSDRFTSMP